MFDKKNLLGVGITNATYNQVLEYVIKGLLENAKKYFIVTVNPEILVLATKNSIYKKILNRAKLALPDGIGIILAGKILGKPLKARITGVDLLEDICRRVAEKPITVGFLGGRGGVANKTAECLVEKYPGLKIAFAGSEWPTNLPSNHIDILFVAFGAPKQEVWISQNLDKLPVRITIGVGGAFDYISGRVSRAPLFVGNLGLEWLFRLFAQPWRLKRQLALLEFAWLVMRERIVSKRKFVIGDN